MRHQGQATDAGMECDGSRGGGEERGLDLVADLRSILNNSHFCDVVLISKEGDRISACRTLLAARSPLFRQSLMSSLTLHTRHSPDIPLPSIRTCALLSCLDYIHTGTLSTHALTLHNVIDVIYASRHFLLPRLHSLSLSFFNEQMQSPDFPIHQLPAFVSRAVELLTPTSEKQVFSQLVSLLDVSFQRFDNITDLSSEALCFYLEETQNSVVRVLGSGYARLRFVLMWCAHMTSATAVEAMDEYLPKCQDDIAFSNTFDATQNAACLQTLMSCRGSLEARFEPLLHCLDIFQVHPRVLAGVIEPLGIIQPSHLCHIYGFQAMISKDATLLQRKQVCHPQYETGEEACVLRCYPKGFATTESPITSTMGVFEWDFVIEESCPSLGIGISSIPAHMTADCRRSWLGYESFGWVLACTGELFHNAQGYNAGRVAYAPEFGRGSRIRVHLDMTKGTCGFVVDGKECGVAWTNIPSKVYAAITVRAPRSTVRLEIARDEDKKMLLELLQSSAMKSSRLPICSDREERISMMEFDGHDGGAEGAQIGSDLVTDLGNILNNSAFGDLLLVSKDGDRIWACRILLGARCQVLERMLLNGVTLESESAHLCLPSIHTCALLCVLEYIYTGSLSKYCLTLDNALEVICAARYLLLTQLESLALSFFLNHAHSLCYPRHDLVNGLSRAMEHLSLDSDTHVFSVFVKAIMQFPQVLEKNAASFSFEALSFFLHKTQTRGIGVSVFEYTRLRCTLMWCAHSISTLAEEALREYLPAQQSDFLSRSFDVWRAQRPALLESMASFQGLLKDQLKPLLQHLDLFRVLPEILLKVLEPMGIVNPAYLLHIFRFQAMFSQHMNRLRWEDGAHPFHFAIHEEGCVLENTSKKNLFGFATTKLPITSSTGIFEWDVVVERTSPHLGIGFCSTEAASHASTQIAWLGYKEYGWVLCCNGSLFHNCKPGENGQIRYAPTFGNGARIRVHIDWARRECSFTVNGIACGVAWTNIPREVYPTVTMQSPGLVRLEVVGDKEKERLLTSLRLAGA